MLSEQRQKIDQIDQELVSLLEKRLAVVTEVAEIKKAQGIAILDSSREEQVFEKIKGYVENPSYEESVLALYREMMRISRDYQQKQNT
ncbi:chorismate mutase [Vagococcus salmoninarum]|uniref:Chorismate mutase n=1 Tax=Vagococcus salmoninarum TaxID=2739 RepID=A0A429ZCN7_9ENTE|nr:chorismate mutase [Vagococcus salmoninarum]MBE9389631.1 chorismate mutase [Vagococcus salmoninarum]RST91439.1 chorismate mutase [Vagococcus salmoninarum]